MARVFHRGEYLFRQGEFANRFYLIETGSVSVSTVGPSSRVITVELVGPGSLVGWSWLFPPYLWHFDARAAERTEAIFFYGTILREYCEKDPSLGFELLKCMSSVMLQRLQAARLKLLDDYPDRARSRGLAARRISLPAEA